MLTTNAFAEIGALIGDPARASMVIALMNGRALTATELAAAAGVTPQTASSHLQQLVAAGLLAMERQGRHRYHRLASPVIAQMVEGMMAVASATTTQRSVPRSGPKDEAMRQARTCYDHLAGRVAVAIADTMVARGDIDLTVDGGALTTSGVMFLEELGIDVSLAGAKGRGRRVFCRPCLDWSERRPHLAGLVGALLLEQFRHKAWIRMTLGSRAVTITRAGRQSLTSLFDLDRDLWRQSDLRT